MLSNLDIKSTKSKNGFTVVEVIFAIGILGVLSTITLNGFNRHLNNSRLKQATQAFIDFAKSSKSKSLSSASPCELIISHETAQITISNPFECSNMGTLKLISDFNDDKDLIICGTNDTSNINMLCDEENDGSDPDMNGIPKSSTSIRFTSKGTVSQGALVKIYSPNSKQGYCAITTAPVGIIRQTRLIRGTCDFTN